MRIDVDHVTKRFGSFTALDDVSLSLGEGKLVALLGPSGCGKTTLLRMIAGLDRPDDGRILVDGSDVSGTHLRERQVGFVFQHYALFRHMSVLDNVAFGMRVKPRRERLPEDRILERAHELLRLVQLDWVAQRAPGQLSGGQRQRVALARALAVEPKVLLLDEPFGALDAKVRKELRRWLRELHAALGITTVFVTHDQEEALELADEIVLMNKGRVEQIGSPENVYRDPATEFACGFLGSSNRFSGTVSAETFATGCGVIPAPGIPDGDAIAYVRPHEWTLHPPQGGAIAATVRRIWPDPMG